MLKPLLLSLLLAGSGAALADVGGHGKLRGQGFSVPSDSLFRESTSSVSTNLDLELRLNGRWQQGGIGFELEGQAFASQGDRVAVIGAFGRVPFPDDDRRAVDLTHVVSEGSDRLLLTRIDRAVVSYTKENLVIRAGRQALSWGGGLFFGPLDLVNPFDPAAIDTEYKVGDDLFYAQLLLDDGSDIEFAWVFRQDPFTGRSRSDVSSQLGKYRTRFGDTDFTLLGGRHYDETVAGLGLSGEWSGAVWRVDALFSDTDDEVVAQLVANLSRSWVAFDRNMTGSAEIYYNGFGSGSDDVTFAELPEALLERLTRGEQFTIGRRYLAANLSVEWTPLLNVSATVFAGLDSNAALLQLGGRYSVAENIDFLFTVDAPLGPKGSEFRGLRLSPELPAASRGAGFFIQLARYF
ncbi:MAG: hypothetical protein AAGI27_07210 [Pseudomonadota bacterium]